MTALSAESARLLGELIRARSVNPPGGEDAPARVLATYLRRGGIAATAYESAPGRTNLVARVPGTGGGPALLLLTHLDTVDAERAEWSTDPWGGEIRDGCVWGRGALDLKGQAAAQAVAVASLVRDRVALRGDVVLAATADEERGSRLGTRWMLDTHPDALRAEYALTHGAGDRMVLDGRAVYFCAVAERAYARLSVTLTGPAGLAMLAENTNVVERSARFITRVAGQQVADATAEEVAVVMRALTGTPPPPGEVTVLADAAHPALRTLLAPLTGATLAPTTIASSTIAGRAASCTVEFDCWLLPGQHRTDVERLVHAAAGGLAHEIRWSPVRGGSRSPASTSLWHAIETFVDRVDPGGVVLPLCDAGFTDSHWLRERYGTVAYGFFPMREMTTLDAARAVHGPDERMPLSDLALQIDFYRHVVTAVCGDATTHQEQSDRPSDRPARRATAGPAGCGVPDAAVVPGRSFGPAEGLLMYTAAVAAPRHGNMRADPEPPR